MPKFLSAIDTRQIPTKNLVLDQASAFPSSPVAGQTFYRSDSGLFYGYNGSAWVALNSTTATDSGWIAFPYASGWGDFDSANWAAGAYRKIGNIVRVRGLVKNTNALSSGTEYTIGTLPSGYRPPASIIVPGVAINSGVRLTIYGVGPLSIVPDSAVAANSFISINCSFTTD